MRYVIEVFRSPGGVHGNVVDESDEEGDAGHRTPFHGWLELLSLLEPPDTAAAETGEPASATDGDSCGC
ncbi:hypothetical protein GCM10010277_57800 [Streptomyces longisporoflavus]|uniref:hypothetical protein n=1 Tax=Streptomyces longisporoflavus TaxID=28044 RepID=UPI00167CF9F2|nr:hypothetical protein [Streptomyces longisporoflavus]GGV56458.1 hypothetical protein GCM10010277_57800 [Streptomyces longisporoflavus]